MFNKSVLATLVLAAAVTARPHDVAQRHNAAQGVHAEANHTRNDTLLRRGQSFQSVRLSMYSPETGNQVACGGYYHDSDMIVALNAAQFEAAPDHMCGQQITLTRNGQTVQATIVDECPSSSCPYGGLDCSPAIANILGFYNGLAWDGAWSIGGGDPAPAPPPASSSTPPAPPPSSSKPPRSSSTPPPPPPSSTTTHASSTAAASSTTSSAPASTSSVASATSAASSSSAAASTAPPPAATAASNIANLNTNVVNMALLALASENH